MTLSSARFTCGMTCTYDLLKLGRSVRQGPRWALVWMRSYEKSCDEVCFLPFSTSASNAGWALRSGLELWGSLQRRPGELWIIATCKEPTWKVSLPTVWPQPYRPKYCQVGWRLKRFEKSLIDVWGSSTSPLSQIVLFKYINLLIVFPTGKDHV